MKINTEHACITLDSGQTFTVEERDGNFPVARSYKVDNLDGIEATMSYEDDSFNPRQDFDNFGVMVSIGNDGYLWGDEQWDSRFEGMKECPRCEGTGDDPERAFITRGRFGGERVGAGTIEAMEGEAEFDDALYVHNESCSLCEGEGEIETTLTQHLKDEYDAVVILGVSFSSHGPQSSCSVCKVDNDDSDNGVIYATKAKIKEEFGDEDIDAPFNEKTKRAWGDDPPQTRREAIERLLTGEVETYDQWLQGDVYWNRVTDSLSGYDEGCGGLFGSDYAEEEIYRELGVAIERHLAEVQERAAMAARDIMTVS
jgi:hypothetical protein